MLDYDREAAHYDATRGGDARAEAAAGAIERLLTQVPVGQAAGLVRIADLACGTGIVTVRLAGPGRHVIGMAGSARVTPPACRWPAGRSTR
jgi:2-polyprenyl-3-methyl-5-hydroxy-6-metoxy-1,4-benzoquinol methylase